MVSAPSVRLLLLRLFDIFLEDIFSSGSINGPAGVLVTSFEPYNCTAWCRAPCAV